MAHDPICGKLVDELRARAVAIYGTQTFYFCSPEHKVEFLRDPSPFVGESRASPGKTSGRASEAAVPSAAPRAGSGRIPLEVRTVVAEGARYDVGAEEGEENTPLPAPLVAALDPEVDDGTVALPPGQARRSSLWLVFVVLAVAAIAGVVVLFLRRH